MPPHANLRVYRFANTESVGLHWHEFYEVMLIIGGVGLHYLNGAALPLRGGSFCLLSPSDFHEVAPIPGQTLHFWNIIFTDALLRDPVSELLFNDTSTYHIEVGESECTRLAADCERLWQEANEQQIGHRIVAQATLDRLLIALRRNAPSDAPSNTIPTTPVPVRQALRFIQQHFREPLTLSDVAMQVRLSPAYFSDSFRRATGQTFQIYVQQQRLQFARSLLAASELPVSEICHAAGFNSLSHFVRAFKHQYGVPPRHYRLQAKSEHHA
jgi:AraC-like DNA-binding protein